MKQIQKVAVIGAGVMGANIAAHVANSGTPVLLLDIVPKNETDRSKIAKRAIKNFRHTKPLPLMKPANAKLISPLNIEDDLDKLSDVDLIIEAIVENPDHKKTLYEKLDRVRKQDSIISSNTSTIPLAKLIEGQSERFKQDFLITHFFNPPRYMPLVELVYGPDTNPEAINRVQHFVDQKLGKTIIECNDRPGFIANRLGVYWLQIAANKAIQLDLTIENCDAILGKPFGVPKTGVFGLLDMVGLDLIPHVNASMMQNLPSDDPFMMIGETSGLIKKMISDGRVGRKAKAGFYRVNYQNGTRQKASINLQTGEYEPGVDPDVQISDEMKKNLSQLFTGTGIYGKYALEVMGNTLNYAASLVGDASDTIDKIDDAMKAGYNWQFGPFELMDKIGINWLLSALEEMEVAISPVLKAARGKSFYRIKNGVRQMLTVNGDYQDIVRRDGVLLLSDIRLQTDPIIQNRSASLWDIGDGITCFEFNTKMNSIDQETFTLLNEAIELVREKFRALIIYSEGPVFSAGVNLKQASITIDEEDWQSISDLVVCGQNAMEAISKAPFPVVGAPSGIALGGGCEFLLHCDHIQAHAETYMGLVEVGVGVIPAWGGCKELLARFAQAKNRPEGPMPIMLGAFEIISAAMVSKSADDAKKIGFLRDTDGITMNRNRLLADAKQAALNLAENYVVREEKPYHLPGPSGKALAQMIVNDFYKAGKATEYDLVVAEALTDILSGGNIDPVQEITNADILELERKNFIKLVKLEGTQKRIKHMLETGKALRN